MALAQAETTVTEQTPALVRPRQHEVPLAPPHVIEELQGESTEAVPLARVCRVCVQLIVPLRKERTVFASADKGFVLTRPILCCPKCGEADL